MEGKPRPLREGESVDQLAEPLNTYAKEAGLVMRRPPKIAYTMYALIEGAYLLRALGFPDDRLRAARRTAHRLVEELQRNAATQLRR